MDHGSATELVPERFLIGVSGPTAKLGLRQLASHDLVQPQGSSWQLTPAGVEVAAKDAENRQLWSLYRQYSDELHLPLVAEDRQAADSQRAARRGRRGIGTQVKGSRALNVSA